MAKFLKLDLIEDDELPIVTEHEAETMKALIKEEYASLLDDDRLSPCFGTTIEEALSHDEDSIQWSPGDGGGYTIVRFFPTTPEGQKALEEYFC